MLVLSFADDMDIYVLICWYCRLLMLWTLCTHMLVLSTADDMDTYVLICWYCRLLMIWTLMYSYVGVVVC